MDAGRKTVVFFGDSLTLADYLRQGFVDMLAENWTDVTVLNHGVNGDTAADLLNRAGEVQEARPDWVFLMVGANDCGWGVPPPEYKATMRSLVAALRPASVVLVTPTTSAFAAGANEPYVTAVKEIAEDEGLPVIDFAAAIQDSDLDFDGLHWNSGGHRRLAEMIDAWRRERGGW